MTGKETRLVCHLLMLLRYDSLTPYELWRRSRLIHSAGSVWSYLEFCERHGLVACRRTPYRKPGQVRREYSITPKGRQYLEIFGVEHGEANPV